jgi:hypothetical protein
MISEEVCVCIVCLFNIWEQLIVVLIIQFIG